MKEKFFSYFLKVHVFINLLFWILKFVKKFFYYSSPIKIIELKSSKDISKIKKREYKIRFILLLKTYQDFY